MPRAIAVLLVLLLGFPRPTMADETAKIALQATGGAAAGLVVGGAVALAGLIVVFCEYDCANEDVGLALVLGSPLVFATADAGAVYLIGRHFDGREARFWPTLAGAAVGTAAGTALWLGSDQTTESFVGAVAIASAGAVVGYSVGRRRSPRRAELAGGRLEVHLPRVQPRLALAPDGRPRFGADVRVLDVRF